MQLDRLLGFVGFWLVLIAYVYYTVWVLITPFVDPKIWWFHDLFPDRWWALAVPTVGLVLCISGITVFVGIVSWRGGEPPPTERLLAREPTPETHAHGD